MFKISLYVGVILVGISCTANSLKVSFLFVYFFTCICFIYLRHSGNRVKSFCKDFCFGLVFNNLAMCLATKS